MPLDRVAGSKLPKWANRDEASGLRYDTATYVGIVKDNKDPIRSGRLRIWIPDFGGVETDEKFWRTVSYASPFFGSTYQPASSKNNTFAGVNHTYGMWFTPPDIENQVLCTFVNGDPDRGYWFACINPTLSHYMVPGIAAGNKVDSSLASAAIKPSILPADTKTPQYLPTTEFNENANDAFVPEFYTNPKPIHEFQANILFKQGLDRDNVRGGISSNSQRESPSQVFGISTPGRSLDTDPADDPNYVAKLAAGNINPTEYAVKARKGGHTFVMDDGDNNGDNQLIRLRTAGGHQILMHDTENLMYISNSEGSVWIELGQDGKMQIYTASSFSVRSESDINLHGKNVNINAENSINLSADSSINATTATLVASASDSALLFGGKLTVGAGGLLTVGGGTIAMGAEGAIAIDGTSLDLNSGGAGNNVTGVTLKQNSFPDASFDEKTRLWNSVPDSITSIVSVLPAHEPKIRSATTPAPTKTIPPSVCPPKTSLPSGNIKGIAPSGSNNEQLVENALIQYGVKDPTQLAAIMAQCSHESGGFVYLKELGDDSYFTRPGHYEGRGDLGNTQPGDGLKFKGRGFIQLTGRDVYNKLGGYLGMDLINEPAQAEDPVTAAKGVLFFFFNYKASRTATVNWADCAAVTRIVNGGLNGLADRQARFAQYQAKYANGIPTPSATTSGNKPAVPVSVSDGAGNVVATGATTSTGDMGIKNAAGQTISDNCPADWLSKTTCYNPPSGIGSSNPKFTQQQVLAMCAELGYYESRWDYAKLDGGYIGKYQVDAQYLVTYGYIKPDAIKWFKTSSAVLANNESWTGKDNIRSQTDFMKNTQVQDAIQFQEFSDNYTTLLGNGGIKSTDDICTAAGMLFVAHQFESAADALTWRNEGTQIAKGVPGAVYFNHGRYSIDVLSISAAGTSITAPTAGAQLPVTNTTGIDPTTVLDFTGQGSGTLASFQQTSSDFQAALLTAAKAYKDKTGSKILVTSAYRSPAEQQALYERWQAAGGKIPERPTAAGITTPAKPASLGGKLNAHGSGAAIDSGQAALVNGTINLAQYGLRWGGTFSTSDPVHIQLVTFQ